MTKIFSLLILLYAGRIQNHRETHRVEMIKVVEIDGLMHGCCISRALQLCSHSCSYQY